MSITPAAGPSGEEPAIDLPPPKNDMYTLEELKQYDGSDEHKPIFVSLKGTVFDVTSRRTIYGKDCSYNCFAGRDASRAIGLSTIKKEEIHPDYSKLNDAQMKILDTWYEMYSKKYPIVGKITNLPPAVVKLQTAAAATS